MDEAEDSEGQSEHRVEDRLTQKCRRKSGNLSLHADREKEEKEGYVVNDQSSTHEIGGPSGSGLMWEIGVPVRLTSTRITIGHEVPPYYGLA